MSPWAARTVNCRGRALRHVFSTARRKPDPVILVLDLDETLLRSKVEWEHPRRKLAWVDVRIYLNGIQCSACFRPGLGEFLDWIKLRRDAGLIEGPWVFSAGARVFVDAMVQEMDPSGDLFGGRVLSKESCTPFRYPWPWVFKDLSKIPFGTTDVAAGRAPNLARTVLVENSSLSCMMFPDNALLVHDWLGNTSEDNELARVSALIDGLIQREAEEVTGSYAGHLARAPGHAEFRTRLAQLVQRLEEPAPTAAELRDAQREVLLKARAAKEPLLGLSPAHVQCRSLSGRSLGRYLPKNC
eukprot:TRINITY_DN98170_c0_g1_i1.p1 TRINITY_DN98170_c0_g1~~TRINITY_DN98170_c0_g1_i1.p1  ORF type:complete len:299 (+),score=38.85 TRINITY_DN98170_c0_g1_i1:21-917(+)